MGRRYGQGCHHRPGQPHFAGGEFSDDGRRSGARQGQAHEGHLHARRARGHGGVSRQSDLPHLGRGQQWLHGVGARDEGDDLRLRVFGCAVAGDPADLRGNEDRQRRPLGETLEHWRGHRPFRQQGCTVDGTGTSHSALAIRDGSHVRRQLALLGERLAGYRLVARTFSHGDGLVAPGPLWPLGSLGSG